ncbi:hypothetical protein [Agromyces albus]|uniref:DUF3558 domain-containing protein n=1 Tax=Agromyces albus TaxID=205332 RepID=A0A4Q2KU02_9MICO|nr:hypothetical protein [Agromyces albus]RXZ68020.1 hypothetical protein ESP51_15315 [Agromyces albus]
MRTEPPTGDELTRLLVSMKRNVLEQVAHEPQSALKRSPLTDRVLAVLLGVALLLGLGAGAAFAFGIVPSPLGAPSDTAPDSTATTSQTPTPVPTPTPTPSEFVVVPADTWEQPASRYGLDCESMIDDSFVSALFTSAVAPVDPIVTAAGVGIAIPRRTSILSLGGTVCEWSNGAPANDQYGVGPDYFGVMVTVVPRPVDGWSERAVRYGMPLDGSHCSESGCYATSGIGDAWVAVEAHGGQPNALNPSGWQPLLDAITEAVSAAGPATEPMAPERTRAPLPEDCGAFISLDTVRSISSKPEAESYIDGGGGWSEWGEARYQAGNTGCNWGSGEDYVASVDWVRDGRWAYERMLAAATASPLELEGLGSHDEASIRCYEMPDASACAVDLAVGPDWINVSGNDRETAIALAEAVLAQLAP